MATTAREPGSGGPRWRGAEMAPASSEGAEMARRPERGDGEGEDEGQRCRPAGTSARRRAAASGGPAPSGECQHRTAAPDGDGERRHRAPGSSADLACADAGLSITSGGDEHWRQAADGRCRRQATPVSDTSPR